MKQVKKSNIEVVSSNELFIAKFRAFFETLRANERAGVEYTIRSTESVVQTTEVDLKTET
jgi:hypothetical protein